MTSESMVLLQVRSSGSFSLLFDWCLFQSAGTPAVLSDSVRVPWMLYVLN